MRACIHRGSHQIGGSCVEVEHGGQRLLVDLGLPLDAEENESRYLPTIKGLDGQDPSLLGVLISHPHLDHYGLLAHLPQTIPVGLGPAARRILEAAAPFLPGKPPVPAAGWNYESGKPLEIGPFRIIPYLVDHSAYDAYSLLIEAGGKRLFYSGDFRGHGRKRSIFERFVAHPPSEIDALLVEGSSLGRLTLDGTFPSEADIEHELVEKFRGTKGLVLVHTSVQNVDRIVSIFRAAKRMRRTLVIDLYAAVILEATGNMNVPQHDWSDVALFVPKWQRLHIKAEQMFDVLKNHSRNRIYAEDLQKAPETYAMLFRPLHRMDLERAGCVDDASYLYSQWEGYWDEGSFDILRAWLEQNGIPKYNVHTSGHASPTDLKRFVAAISPKRVVPIHSFQPERYPELFGNVTPHEDGEWWDV